MTRSQRGGTLIEALFAMAVMLSGAAAMVGLHRQTLLLNADGRRLTRAAALASDLLTNLERLDYADPLLANTNAGNDGDLVDSAYVLEDGATDPATVTDHAWTELPANWPGMTAASAVTGGTALGTNVQLYWSISETVGPTYSYKHIAAIVRWDRGSDWRRIVALGTKPGLAYIP